MSAPNDPASPNIEIGVAELAARLGAGEKLRLLDVREPWEFEFNRLPGGELLPLARIPLRLEELGADPEAEIICYCHTGNRSLTAADWLRRAGVRRARSLAGGIDQWSRDVDATVPRY